MTFKWPGTPTRRAKEGELADYVELCCARDGSVSVTSLTRDLGRVAENDYSHGVPVDEAAEGVAVDAFGELERRTDLCGGGYPFQLAEGGQVLECRRDPDNRQHVVYEYLLMATRLNMKDDREHGGLDGTALLEELGESVAREYLGQRAEGMVFGTGAGERGFAQKVDELCRRLREGGGFSDRTGSGRSLRDGRLDVVAWKPFSDALPGKLIAFGQCKTGTNFSNELERLQPDAFCAKWLEDPLAVKPVRLFFVAEAVARTKLYEFSLDAGVVFDRLRIVDYSREVRPEVLERLQVWTTAAAEARGWGP